MTHPPTDRPNQPTWVRPASLAAVLLAYLVLCAPVAGLMQDSTGYGRTLLANGLEVIVVENHAVPLVTVLVAVRTGAFTQQQGQQGIAHLLEHALFRTYGGRPTDFSRAASGMRAAYNGATSVDVVTYYLTLPSEKTNDALRLLGRLMRDAAFDAADVNDELPIVLDELARTESDHEAAFRRRMEEQLWGEDWYRRDLLGDSTSLATLTRADMELVFDRYYRSNNAALIVTGDVDTDKVLREAEKRFGDWAPGPPPFADDDMNPALPPLVGTRAVMMPGAVLDVTVRIAIRGPGLATDPESVYAMDVLTSLLNEPTARIQELLVAEGPFQSLTFAHRATPSPTPVIIVGTTTDAEAERAIVYLSDALNQLEAFLSLTEDDLEIVKKRRRVDRVLDREKTAVFAPALAAWWAGPGIEAMGEYSDRLSERTLEDLVGVVRRYVSGAPRVIGVLGPQPTIDRLLGSFRGRS